MKKQDRINKANVQSAVSVTRTGYYESIKKNHNIFNLQVRNSFYEKVNLGFSLAQANTKKAAAFRVSYPSSPSIQSMTFFLHTKF